MRASEDGREEFEEPDGVAEDNDMEKVEGRFEDAIKRLEAVKARIKAQIQIRAGSMYGELESSEQSCMRILESSVDKDLCWAAIQLLLRHREISSDTAVLFRSIALDRSRDAQIRALALGGLLNHFRSTGNATDFRLFVDLIYDKSQDYKVVRSCYFNILSILMIPFDQRPGFSEFKIPDDIDYRYLSQILGKAGFDQVSSL